MNSQRPAAIVLLSLLLPGLGHAAVGKSAKGMFLFCLFAGIVPLVARIAVRLPAAAALPVLVVGVIAALIVFVYAARDAFRTARTLQKAGISPPNLSGYAAAVALIAGYLFVLLPLSRDTREHVIELYRIPSESMRPEIAPGAYLFADKRVADAETTRPINRGDTVIFIYPNDRSRRYIKRVVGLPGDRIAFRDGTLLVNDTPATAPSAASSASGPMRERAGETTYAVLPWRTNPRNFETVVPPGHAYVLADNRDHGVDSRRFGPIPLRDIIGIALR